MAADKLSESYVVLVTVSSEEAAASIARTVVEEKLAACGNIVGRIRSIYRWQGEVQDEPETLLVLKTAADRLEELRRRVVGLHSYDVPEFVALKIEQGHAPYLEWIEDSTR